MHILITGASSGIGEAIARYFGERAENKLTLVARRLEKLEALAKLFPGGQMTNAPSV